MHNKVPGFLLPLLLLLGFVPAQAGDGEVELAEYMGTLQHFTHKLQLSLEAKNLLLADFYAHELEEVIKTLSTVESYDDHAIGKLTDAMLEPAFELLEKQVKAKNISRAMIEFDQFVNTCNACHQETEYGFIKIEKNSQNPYMQSFVAE